MADVYAEQLFPMTYGHALWYPQPDELTGHQPIEIGDVGYIMDGAFVRLFNVTRPLPDSNDSEAGVADLDSLPDSYELLPIPHDKHLYRVLPEELKNRVVYSRSVSVYNAQASVERFGIG